MEIITRSTYKSYPIHAPIWCPNFFLFEMLFQVIEVTPMHCVVQISKSCGELRLYNEVLEIILFFFSN
jgi:hypothetical protein